MKRDSSDVDHDVAECAAVFINQLEMMKEASYTTEPCYNFSPAQEAGSSNGPESCIFKW